MSLKNSLNTQNKLGVIQLLMLVSLLLVAVVAFLSSPRPSKAAPNAGFTLNFTKVIVDGSTDPITFTLNTPTIFGTTSLPIATNNGSGTALNTVSTAAPTSPLSFSEQPVTGFKLTGFACQGASKGFGLVASSGTFTVGVNDNDIVNCTITNTFSGSLTIVNTVAADAATATAVKSDFVLDALPQFSLSPLPGSSAQKVYSNLAGGMHTINWLGSTPASRLVSMMCDSDSGMSEVTNNDPNVTCTYYTTLGPINTFVFRKEIVGAPLATPTSYTLNISGNQFDTTPVNTSLVATVPSGSIAAVVNTNGFYAGTYTISETLSTNYQVLSTKCYVFGTEVASSTYNTPITLDFASNGSYQCTVVNKPIKPQITINKTVTTENGKCAGADALTVPSGTKVTYCIEVKNTGDITLSQVTVTDPKLGITTTIGTLSPSQSSLVTKTVTAKTMVNTATVTAKVSQNGVLSQSLTKTDTATVSVSNLKVTKAISYRGNILTDTLPVLTVGTPISWIITVANNTPVSMTIVYTDTYDTQILTKTTKPITVTAGTTVTLAYQGVITYGTHTNMFQVAGTPLDGSPKQYGSASASYTTPGRLTIYKKVVNSYGGTLSSSDFPLFYMTGAMTTTKSIPSGGSLQYTGMVTVSEIIPARSGYEFVGFSGDCNSLGVVTIANGQNLICTLTNADKAPQVAVIKKIVDTYSDVPASLNDFTFTVFNTPNGLTTTTIIKNVLHDVPTDLKAGKYNIVEDADSNYSVLYSPSCGGTIDIDETEFCVITNTRLAGMLTINHTVLGTPTASSFVVSIEGDLTTSETLTEAGSITLTVPSGVYTIDEAMTDNSYGLADCSINGTPVVTGTAVPFTITVGANNDVVCDLTAVYPTSSLTIANEETNVLAPSVWGYTVTGLTPYSVELTGTMSNTAAIFGGVYTIDVPSMAGYTTSYDCKIDGNNGPAGTVPSTGGQINLSIADGDMVVCTVTQSRTTGNLTIINVVTPTVTMTDDGYTYSVSGGDSYTVSLMTGESNTEAVVPATYTITGQKNTQLIVITSSNFTCSRNGVPGVFVGSFVPTGNSSGFTLPVDPNDVIVCHVTHSAVRIPTAVQMSNNSSKSRASEMVVLTVVALAMMSIISVRSTTKRN